MASWALQTGSLLAACVSSFGEPVVYTSGADFAQVAGIVDDSGQPPDAIPGEIMAVGIRVADLMAAFGRGPQTGDSVAVRGTSYDVFGVSIDSEGMSTLTFKISDD